MTEFPDPADLYPDIVAKGSLAAAIEASAAVSGVALDGAVANAKKPLLYATVASTSPLRDPLVVSAGHLERSWSISGWGQGIDLVHGRTHDLAEIAKAAQLWREGTLLSQIECLLPFVKLRELAAAAEQGPAEVVAARWQTMLQKAADADWPEFRALVEAAYANPVLRALFPVLSHGCLGFSANTGYPYSPGPTVWAGRNGSPPRVWMGSIQEETGTPEEAVSLAIDMLPGGIAPAVAGPYQG